MFLDDVISLQSCHSCNGDIDSGDVAVYARRVHEHLCWHPGCFVCAQCEEQLVDLVYCHHEGQIYCERHYAEIMKPRCAACDEVSDKMHIIHVPVYMYVPRIPS